MRVVLLLTCSACVGCGGGSYSSPSPSSYSRPSNSQVMSESHRANVVDHMVGQGANRDEAEAFTRALNQAQREWEASR